MEEKKKLNRTVHGEEHKTTPNMHVLMVYLYNPPRKGHTKGSNVFKTTHRFRDVLTIDAALELFNQFTENRSTGDVSFSAIKKAVYNEKCIVLDGSLQ